MHSCYKLCHITLNKIDSLSLCHRYLWTGPYVAPFFLFFFSTSTFFHIKLYSIMIVPHVTQHSVWMLFNKVLESSQRAVQSLTTWMWYCTASYVTYHLYHSISGLVDLINKKTVYDISLNFVVILCFIL
jgi:hypothetical protein